MALENQDTGDQGPGYSLIPVEHDPFQGSAQDYLPVDYDPFAGRQLAGPLQSLVSAGGRGLAREVETVAPQMAAKGFDVLHYSPHDFPPTAENPLGQFDISKIGTGQGAQTYSSGLYFAENPRVTDDYRRMLSPAGMHAAEWTFDPTGLTTPLGETRIWKEGRWQLAPEAPLYGGQPRTLTWQGIQSLANSYLNPTEAGEVGRAMANYVDNPNPTFTNPRAQEFWKRVTGPPRGATYQTHISADPENDFLDWDKPLWQQNPQVTSKLERILGPRPDLDTLRGLDREGPAYGGSSVPGAAQFNREWNSPWRGSVDDLTTPGAPRFIYSGAKDWRDANDVRNGLGAIGIKGTRYLDEGSRITASIPAIQDKLDEAQGNLDYWKKLTASDPKMAGGKIDQYQKDVEHWNTLLGNAQKYLPGTRNYVVYDDKITDIMKKYGMAGLVAGGIAHYALQPVDHDPFQQ